MKPKHRNTLFVDFCLRARKTPSVVSRWKVAYAGKLRLKTVPKGRKTEFLNHIWGVFESPPSTFWFFRCFVNFDKPPKPRIWSKNALLCTFRCFGTTFGFSRQEMIVFQVALRLRLVQNTFIPKIIVSTVKIN